MVQSIFSFAGLSVQTVAAALVALMAGTGCQSAAPATATPVASALEVNVEDPDQPEPLQPRPTYPDGYPNFAGSLSAASVQMGNDEAAALQAQLTSLGAARKAGTISEAEYQARLLELRRIAAEHGAETQAQITN